MRGGHALLLAAIACGLAACGPIHSAGDVVAAAPGKIEEAQEAYESAQAFTNLFLPFLPTAERERILAIRARIETALEAARHAATAIDMARKLREAERLTAELRDHG